MDLLSIAVGFVVGGFTGAAGTFYGNKYTDQRRAAEEQKSVQNDWETLNKKFPEIIKEMIEDVKNPDFVGVRTFFVKSKGTTISTNEQNFEYHTDVHLSLNAAIRYMEDLGYIQDITPKNYPRYRFLEHFYDMLRNS